LNSITFEHVTLIAHADWSKNPDKRWMALAVLQADHHWLVSELINVATPSELFSLLKSHMLLPGCILSGFDFPIGIPSAFASKVNIIDFLSVLPIFGLAIWAEFYLPASEPSQISLQRPFYPAKPGHARRSHLEKGLEIPFGQLYRLCEVAHINRRAACPLFWTLGGQQVGKAAISGWEYLLAPALGDPKISFLIWPFSGPLASLCLPGNIVAVETYPAEFYAHLGLSFSSPGRRSKRRQSDRLAFTAQLISWAKINQIDLADPIISIIQAGFGNKLDGEDQFDALVGLYGMINLIQGNRAFYEPRLPDITKIEGWIFGQEAPSWDTCVDRSCKQYCLDHWCFQRAGSRIFTSAGSQGL